jgi:hypothetical protein
LVLILSASTVPVVPCADLFPGAVSVVGVVGPVPVVIVILEALIEASVCVVTAVDEIHIPGISFIAKS